MIIVKTLQLKKLLPCQAPPRTCVEQSPLWSVNTCIPPFTSPSGFSVFYAAFLRPREKAVRQTMNEVSSPFHSQFFLVHVMSFWTAILLVGPRLMTECHLCKVHSGSGMGNKCNFTELILSICMGGTLWLSS